VRSSLLRQSDCGKSKRRADEKSSGSSQATSANKEEERVKELEEWVTAGVRAKEIREFVAELEARWVSAGEDISSSSSHGPWLNWMRQQADRLDPPVESPPSVLDRKHELRYW